MQSTKLTFILLLLLFLLVMVVQVCKAEPVYTVSGSELNDMKHYIELIRQENRQLQNDLKNSRISLEQAEERRRSLESQLEELINGHRLLSEERSELETLLKDLRESFEQLKAEAQSKIGRLVVQRNLALIVAILAAFW
jgi:septal ring factor EnvC (AmiA/AmiB activator)